MYSLIVADRIQFAALIMFHYLFPPVTIGLGVLIAILKTAYLLTKEDRYNLAARFWSHLLALNFGAGVVTGIPMEFQFGTNWSKFSVYSGGVIGQGLMLEGVIAFFLESSFIGILIFGEKKVSPFIHWLASIMVALGTIVSAYFIICVDAFMQHPVGYRIGSDGTLELTNLWTWMTNPFELWECLHTVNGALVHGSLVMAAVAAYYILAGKHIQFARICIRLGIGAAFLFSLTQIFPTGSKNGEAVVKYQPTTLAAMEGQFDTQVGAPLAIIGMPDTRKGDLLDPVAVPDLLSYLAYGSPHAMVKGLNDIPRALWPNVEVTYYAYHIMIGLGGVFVGITSLGVFLIWIRRLDKSRWFLWIVLLTVPFPYIANEAGWVVTCEGRQPWIIYGLLKTADGVSPNVSAGEVIFTLIGFIGLYIMIGLLFVILTLRALAHGPDEADGGDQSDAQRGLSQKTGTEGA